MTEPQPVESRLKSLEKVLTVTSKHSARGLTYGAVLLGMAALMPNVTLPTGLTAIAGGLGVNLLANLLDRVANEELSNEDIIEAVETASVKSDISELLTDDKFDHAFTQLRQAQRKLSEQNQLIFNKVYELLQNSEQKVSISAEEIAKLRQSFIDWTVAINSEISIPSLQVALPMSEAWTTLQTLNPNKQQNGDEQSPLGQQIQSYHDWHRLAESVEDKDIIDIEKVIAKQQQIVIVGGAGTGKSTLTRRLTQLWSQQGKLVLRVPLRALALRIESGESFDKAIITIAGEGFPKTNLELSNLLQDATCLLADGLDETGASRADIAKKLRAWASADPMRQIVVTTRSVGHNPAWFSDWHHCELLPLRQDDIENFASKIFSLLQGNEAAAEKETKQFLDKLKSSRTALVAARSPQLLGFLIALYRNAHPIDRNRYQLFQAIIDEMAACKSQDRVFRIHTEKIVADFVLDRLGWLLLENQAFSEREITKQIGQHVAQDFGYPTRRSEQEVTKALEFWTERGLIEQIRIPAKTTFAFIHRGFQEFAATRYTIDMDSADFGDFVAAHRHNPTFREALLMTGATPNLPIIIDIVLNDSDPADPVSTNCIFAAEVLAEAENPPEDVRKVVYKHLLPRLESNIPSIAYEAAQKLLPLAHLNPEVIGTFGQRLVVSDKAWTQEIGCLLSIIAGEKYVNEHILLQAYPNLKDTRSHSFLRANILNSFRHQPITMRLIIEGARYLVNKGYVNVVLDKFKTGDMSGYACNQMRDLLIQLLEPSLIMPLVNERYGYDENLKFFESLRHLNRITLDTLTKYARDAANLLLGDEIKLQPDPSLQSLITIYNALSIGKSGKHDVLALRQQPQVIQEVFKGVILATGLNPAQVQVDAELASGLFTESDEERLNFSSSVHDDDDDDIPLDPTRARDALNPELLFRAIEHPTFFVRGFALFLVVNCVAIEIVQAKFLEKLYKDNPEMLRIIGAIATHIWGGEAANLLLERLEKNFTAHCSPLVEALGKLPIEDDDQPRLIAILQQALKSPHDEVVKAASETISSLNLQQELMTEIRVNYDYWLTEGPPYPQAGGFAVVPHNPAGRLFDLLAAAKAFTYEDLLNAAGTTRRRDVKEKAIDEISKYMQRDDEAHQRVMDDIRTNKLSSAVLLALSKSYPDYCRKYAADFVALLEVDSFEGKIHCLEVLGAGWASLAQVEPTLRSLLDDPNPDIRDEAVKVLRKLLEAQKTLTAVFPTPPC